MRKKTNAAPATPAKPKPVTSWTIEFPGGPEAEMTGVITLNVQTASHAKLLTQFLVANGYNVTITKSQTTKAGDRLETLPLPSTTGLETTKATDTPSTPANDPQTSLGAVVGGETATQDTLLHPPGSPRYDSPPPRNKQKPA